jgi:hypothetical protein
MAAGARSRFAADLAVSVTGIAGPDGGSEEKPVGLVYLGLATPRAVSTVREQLDGDRASIRRAATIRALALLHSAALAEPSPATDAALATPATDAALATPATDPTQTAESTQPSGATRASMPPGRVR